MEEPLTALLHLPPPAIPAFLAYRSFARATPPPGSPPAWGGAPSPSRSPPVFPRHILARVSPCSPCSTLVAPAKQLMLVLSSLRRQVARLPNDTPNYNLAVTRQKRSYALVFRASLSRGCVPGGLDDETSWDVGKGVTIEGEAMMVKRPSKDVRPQARKESIADLFARENDLQTNLRNVQAALSDLTAT
ncbi:hypothetical protein B0H19DRAFT_1260634 [Mycena capillaripes]|nr:hypothetical protein B0H19DRAFT_1260634 [Mycena capillaripes]